MKRVMLTAAMVALLVSGCAQVPTSGPVVEVDQAVPDTASSSFVRALARSPRPGMSQIEIVQGFLDAASGFEDGHAVAREYLTPRAGQTWDPQAGVRVYGNDTETLSSSGEDSVTVTAAQVGVVSDRSQYVPSQEQTTLEEQFGLTQVGSQWRIDDVPDGLLLSRAAVERSYREFQTYFVAKPGGILAPNPVLFARSQGDVTTDLVRALLQGPGLWLEPAVINGFPAGTGLNTVNTVDGIVQIDLTAAVLQADDLARQQLSAQIVWTLRQVPGFRGVTITADGEPVTVPGQDLIQPRSAWPDFDPDGLSPAAPWYIVRSGRVLAMSAENEALPVPGAPGSGQPPVEDPLISLDQSVAAATDPDGQLLTAPLQTPSRWADARTGLRSRGGSWDRTGALWLPDRNVGAQIVNVLGSQKVPIELDQVRSVQISRDGSRALVVAGPRDAATAYLLRVDRTTGPPSLTGPRALVSGPVQAAAWASATQVALLIKQPNQPPQVGSVDLGLFSVRLLGGPPLASTVAAAPDRPLLSGTEDGQVWQFNGNTWVPLTQGRQPRYPG
ncbi:MAG: LpqB family beta-propeller domain-containing protein [Candidatus Nanopelagicales bacterium]